MGTVLFYIFKSTLCLIILYFLFRLFFRKDTLFRTNRLLLLVGTVVCTLLPLLQVDVSQCTPLQLPITAVKNVLTVGETNIIKEEIVGQSPENAQIVAAEKGYIIGENQVNAIPNIPITWILGSLYLVGVLVVSAFFLLSTIRMWRLIRRYPAYDYGKYKLVICPEKMVSFSWGNTVVLSQEDYEKNSAEILLHEQMHLQHRHTLDLLWMECLVILHWFNPAVWLLMRELREVHEYEADNGVINHGIDATKYQLLLVKKSVGTRLYSMACGFNHSKLKNRITMMLKRRTTRWAHLKLLLFVPVAAATLYAFARPEVKKSMEQVMKPVSVKQDSVQRSELEELEDFFELKAGDMFGGKKVMPGKSMGTIHSFFVNMNNKMMLDQVLIKEYDVATLSSRLTASLRKEYEESVKKDAKMVSILSIRYDRGSSSEAITSYLQTIKEAYLQVRGEISEQLGGVSEARLDSILPILVRFEPSRYNSKYKTASDISLPIEVRLYSAEAGQVIKNPTLQELEQKLKDYKATVGADKPISVSLSMNSNVTMGVVEDAKEVIRESLGDNHHLPK